MPRTIQLYVWSILLVTLVSVSIAGQRTDDASEVSLDPGVPTSLSVEMHSASKSLGRQESASNASYYYDTKGNSACMLTILGDSADDAFGHNVRTGDVNGDGIDDLVVTATGIDGSTTNDNNLGGCYVFFGSPGLIPDSIHARDADLVIEGRSIGDRMGYGLELADVNGDDTTDILVSADVADPWGDAEGTVYIFFGTAAFPDSIRLSSAQADVELNGPSNNIGDNVPQAGTALAAGDINGDGIQDILIHASGADQFNPTTRSDVTATWVVLGRTTWQSPSYELELDSSGFLFEPMGGVIFGVDSADAFYEEPPMSGQTYLSANHTIASGDINNDGFDDVLMTFPGGDGPGNTGYLRGEVRVVYGYADIGQDTVVTGVWRYSVLDLTTQSDVVIYGQSDEDRIVYVQSYDINNDLIDDIIVPLRYGDGPGEARSNCGELSVIYGGAPLATYEVPTNADFTIVNADSEDQLRITAYSDLDGDVNRELLFSSYRADGPGNTRADCGEISMFRRPDTLSGVIDLSVSLADATIYGAIPSEFFGQFSSLCIGDLNGDGTDDIIGGSIHGLDTGMVATGLLRVIDGTTFNVSDADSDAVEDACDNCPAIANNDQSDLDLDGVGDSCDMCTDPDGDGFGSPGFTATTCQVDNCPDIANAGQEDADADGIGDACDPCTDLDNDGFGDPGFPANVCALDNCPDTANPGQEDIDNDGIGDACCCQLRGNVNGVGGIDISDLTYIVNFSFNSGPAPPCFEEGNINGIGAIDISDLTYIVSFSFNSGPAPPPCQ